MEGTWNSGKTFLLVTGASRGLGQAFSITLASNLNKGSVVYLTARTEAALLQTKNEISSTNESLQVKYFVIDQAKVEKQAYVDMLKNVDPGHFDSAIVVHNAGSIGKQGEMVRDYDDKDDLCNYYSLNLFSVAVLNSVFMKTFSLGENVQKLKQKFISFIAVFNID